MRDSSKGSSKIWYQVSLICTFRIRSYWIIIEFIKDKKYFIKQLIFKTSNYMLIIKKQNKILTPNI